MAELFIFDMGGVLARNVNILPEAAACLGLEEEVLMTYIEEDLVPLMEGKMGTRAFWKRFSARSGIAAERELWGELFRPLYDRDTEELILKLKKGGFRVVCGTNTLKEHYRIHRKRGDYRVFDKVYASHKLKKSKPRTEFFRAVLKKERRRPEEAFFVDDFPENIRGAEEAGIRSFLFRGPSLLLRELKEAGIGGSLL